MAKRNENGHGFAYIWSIQNFGQWFDGIFELNIESPRFFVNSIKGSQWFLVLKKNGNCLELHYMHNLSKFEPIEVCSEVSFLEADAAAFRLQQKRKFSHSQPYGLLASIDKDDFHVENTSLFVTKELTVRCRLWSADIELENPEICFASTKINSEKENILWAIKGFGSSKSHWEKEFTSKVHNLPVLHLHLYLKADNDEVHISLVTKKRTSTFSFWYIAVVDAIGDPVDSTKFDFPTDSMLEDAKLTTKSKLMGNRDFFLPGDVLFLKCFCVTSYEGKTLYDSQTRCGEVLMLCS